MSSSNPRSWPQLRDALAQLITPTHEHARGFLGLLSDGRVLRVELFGGVATPWLKLRAPVCEQHEMDLAAVLERNSALTIASLELGEGRFWMRVAVPLDSHELADLPRLIALVADGAESLSPVRVRVPEGAGEMFAHYAT